MQVKINQRGVGLIEVLLYIVLTSFISAAFFKFVMREHFYLFSKIDDLNQFIQMRSACDVFGRDIRKAPFPAEQWKCMCSKCIIWSGVDKDVGWLLKKNKFIRVEGVFDEKSQRWRKPRSSCVLLGVKEIEFSLVFDDKAKSVDSVVLSIVMAKKGRERKLEQTFFLKNGELLA